jgi:hypothetical protein
MPGSAPARDGTCWACRCVAARYAGRRARPGRGRWRRTQATVGDHGARRSAVQHGDSTHGREQLWGVGRVALGQLMVGDKAALVLGQQQGGAELGRAVRLALADRAGVRISQRHHPIGNAAVAGKPLLGLPQQPLGERDGLVELASQPSPGRRALARWAARRTAATSRRLCRAMVATCAVSRSTSPMATPLRRRSEWPSWRSRRPAERLRSRNVVRRAAPRALRRRTSPPRVRTACASRSASVG